MYAVCKNGKCANTYHIDEIIKHRSIEEFMEDILITEGFRCEKCKGIVVEVNGWCTLSNYPNVIKYIQSDELEKLKIMEYEKAKRELSMAEEKLNSLIEKYGEL